MASNAEEPRTEGTEEESEGGPVKTFLEHLEDLRWVLIKSLSVVFLTVLVCLLAGNVVVKVLKWPLDRAKTASSLGDYITESMGVKHLANSRLGQWRYTAWLFKQREAAGSHGPQGIPVFLGTNLWGTIQVSPEDRGKFGLGTNAPVVLRIEPGPAGTNAGLLQLWARVETNAALAGPSKGLNLELVNLEPASGFIVAFRIAIYAGLVLSAPFIIYFVAAFVFPALRMKEKKYVYGGMLWGFGLFMIGVSFCYFVLMPVALLASVQYTEWLGFTAPQWRAEGYISFVCKFMLGMGVGFELPVVILVLAKLGIVNYKFLSKARRYVIIINVTLGAILTTPEVITQVLMALPMQLLYEMTVWVVWWQERRAKKRRALEEKMEQDAAAGRQ
jgi:sec-independent protein translocase protein TatC